MLSSICSDVIKALHLTLLQARHYAPSTRQHVIESLKSLCDRLPADRRGTIAQDLALITADDLDAWLQASHDKGLAASTIQSALSTLRQFFAFLQDEGHLARHPIRRHRHDVIVPQHLPRPMAEADIAPFFHVIDSVRDRLMFLLMLRCGLRVSEVCNLTCLSFRKILFCKTTHWHLSCTMLPSLIPLHLNLQ